VLAVGVLLAAGGAWVLRGSPFPPNGYSGDEGFRLASVARDARHLFPSDFAYRGLPAFYPPLYFFLLGRLVALTGMAPYEALKVGTIAVAFLVPLVGYALWRRVTGDVALAVGVVFAGLAVADWFEPYSWIAVVAFVPWWFAFVVRADRGRDPLGRRNVVIGAVVGGCLLMTYYYPFFIGVVQLLAVLVVGRVAGRRGRRFPLRVTRESWCVLGGAVLVSAVYWLPLVVAAVTTGAFASLQNRYFDHWMIAFPLPFLEVSMTGLVMLVGLVSIVLGCRRSSVMLGLATMLVAAYAWIVFGYVMVLADMPVLAFKAVFVVQAVLAAGAGIGVVSLLRNCSTARALRIGLAGLAAVVLVATAVGAVPYLEEQRAAHEPTALLRAYDRATAGRPDGDVVLAGDFVVSFFRPVHLFNVWNAHYSNPVAEFAARSRFLDRLAGESDPVVVAAALRHNRYDPVDVVVLDVAGGRLTATDYQDNYPRGTRARTLAFTPGQFGARWFTRTVAVGQVFLVARPADPLGALDASQRRELRERFAGDLAVPN
jgi:hypothetical protein